MIKTLFFSLLFFLNIHVYVLVLKEKQCSLAICNMYSKPSNLVNSVSALLFKASFFISCQKKGNFYDDFFFILIDFINEN